MFEVFMLPTFLKTSGVLFHTEEPMKECKFCPVLISEKEKSSADKYFLLLNCSGKLIRKLH